MKKYEEYTDQADVLSSGIMPLLDKTIRELMEPTLIGEQMLGKDTSLVGAPGPSKRFRREVERLTAQPFGEKDDVPDISVPNPDDYFDAEPEFYGGSDPVTSEAIADADYNAVQRSLRRIARAMARMSDALIWDEILGAATVTGEDIVGGAAEFDLAHGENNDPGSAIVAVLDITTTNPVTWDNMDYINGHIVFSGDPGASTIDYIWSDGRTYIRAVTAGEIGYEDIVNARTSLKGLFVNPDTIIIDELTEGMLLKDDKFIDASHYGDKVMIKGEIGRIAGMPVVVTEMLYDNLAVVLKKGPELGVKLYKMMMTTELEKIQGKAGNINVKAWEKSIPVVIQPTWIRIIMNGQINAYDE